MAVASLHQRSQSSPIETATTVNDDHNESQVLHNCPSHGSIDAASTLSPHAQQLSNFSSQNHQQSMSTPSSPLLNVCSAASTCSSSSYSSSSSSAHHNNCLNHHSLVGHQVPPSTSATHSIDRSHDQNQLQHNTNNNPQIASNAVEIITESSYNKAIAPLSHSEKIDTFLKTNNNTNSSTSSQLNSSKFVCPNFTLIDTIIKPSSLSSSSSSSSPVSSSTFSTQSNSPPFAASPLQVSSYYTRSRMTGEHNLNQGDCVTTIDLETKNTSNLLRIVNSNRYCPTTNAVSNLPSSSLTTCQRPALTGTITQAETATIHHHTFHPNHHYHQHHNSFSSSLTSPSTSPSSSPSNLEHSKYLHSQQIVAHLPLNNTSSVNNRCDFSSASSNPVLIANTVNEIYQSQSMLSSPPTSLMPILEIDAENSLPLTSSNFSSPSQSLTELESMQTIIELTTTTAAINSHNNSTNGKDSKKSISNGSHDNENKSDRSLQQFDDENRLFYKGKPLAPWSHRRLWPNSCKSHGQSIKYQLTKTNSEKLNSETIKQNSCDYINIETGSDYKGSTFSPDSSIVYRYNSMSPVSYASSTSDSSCPSLSDSVLSEKDDVDVDEKEEEKREENDQEKVNDTTFHSQINEGSFNEERNISQLSPTFYDNSSNYKPKIVRNRLTKRLDAWKGKQNDLIKENELNENKRIRLINKLQMLNISLSDMEKVIIHFQEVEKVTQLLLSLSGRLKSISSDIKSHYNHNRQTTSLSQSECDIRVDVNSDKFNSHSNSLASKQQQDGSINDSQITEIVDNNGYVNNGHNTLEDVSTPTSTSSSASSPLHKRLDSIDENNTVDVEYKSLLSKKGLLLNQLQEAIQLKASIDQRSYIISEKILAKYLKEDSKEDIDDFVEYIRLKIKLVVEQRQVMDKIEHGQRQLIDCSK